MTRKLNPDKLFVIHATSRRGIAELLNEALDQECFTISDERLTDAVCQEFADALADCQGENYEETEVLEHMMIDEFLKRFDAIDFNDEPPKRADQRKGVR